MTLDSVERNIGSKVSLECVSQIEVWFLHLHNRHFRLLWQSVARRLVPVESKYHLFSLKILLQSEADFTCSQSADLSSHGHNKYSQLCTDLL